MQNELHISTRGLQMPESPIRKLAPLDYKAEDEGVKIYRLNIGQPDLPTDYSGINVPLVAVCNVPPVAQCNVPPQKWLQ